jgi:predicted nucleic acid-binding Zn ribbon protein
MTRRAPRPVAFALEELTETLAPSTPLAAVQRIWAEVVGADVAAEAAPTGLRGGVLTVVCRASVWAQELELMGPDVAARLNAELGSDDVVRLRCRATPP